jgi:hypothetical protein
MLLSVAVSALTGAINACFILFFVHLADCHADG